MAKQFEIVREEDRRQADFETLFFGAEGNGGE
jgi:hypothetical protein